MVQEAANDVESITLFQDTLADTHRSRIVLETVWTNVELWFKADVNREGRIEAYMSRENE